MEMNQIKSILSCLKLDKLAQKSGSEFWLYTKLSSYKPKDKPAHQFLGVYMCQSQMS